MRIRGAWGAFDAAYIRAILVSDVLRVRRHVNFLVDTGASRTIIMDSGAKRLGIRYEELQRLPEGTIGVGGVVDTYILPNVRMLFITDGDVHEVGLSHLFVLRHEPRSIEEMERINRLPSLLGRDILNKYRLVMDRARNIVMLTDER